MNVPIVNVMAALDYKPKWASANYTSYDTPAGKVLVDVQHDRWVLSGDHNKAGRAPELVALIKGVPVGVATSWIQETFAGCHLVAAEIRKPVIEGARSQVVRKGPLTSARLIRQLAGKGIPEDVARKHVIELSFCCPSRGTTGYGYGLPNESGGYGIITSNGAPIFVGKADIAIIRSGNGLSDKCLLFMGLLDYLAYVMIHGDPMADTFIMFSSGMVGRLMSALCGFAVIEYYPPNTKAKEVTLPLLLDQYSGLRDMSAMYVPYRSYHEWYLSDGHLGQMCLCHTV